MNNKKRTLQDIFDEEDEFGLLNIKPSASPARNEDERLVSSFQEINAFYEKYKREPQEGKGIQEHTMFARLKSIRQNPTKADILRGYDTFQLLEIETKKIESIDDIFDDDDWDLLTDDTEGLFEFKHIKKPSERESADFVAKRKPCKEFDKFEHLFKNCHKDLKESNRQLTKFHENQIQEGAFFVLNGVLVYVAELINITVDKFSKRDGRTRLIFENGTESNMLYRSLGKGLFENGQGVTFTNEEMNTQFIEEHNQITKLDKEAGFIYVLKSKSEKAEIQSIQHLYKIGYATTSVEERIKNAAKEPTYLMSDVAIVMTYKCYNMNPQKFEQLIHTFFGNACLNIDVFDNKGQRYTPREWFIAPLAVIEQAVDLIVSGKIVDYWYDGESGDIVKR
jgi:hypothetical protein